ncbi:unnamed protein product [Bursaphelenchus okinawaensis]|uniref:Uncharacterized protein n=1 Tax=Bursaphelenchus okinawaensis TaxID=465554 RepID=A0A811KQ14_9BILA|nr:unnamed protein product [Bursaphelenchus okinawaensis]CAG9107690.1 unnamed protein product [Bursaphelenchus okinawaensis]
MKYQLIFTFLFLIAMVLSVPVKESKKPAFVGYCNKDKDCEKECQDFCGLIHNADCNKYQCAGKRCYQTCVKRTEK